MIEIIEVKTRKQLNDFIEFPNKLYKDNPYYVPSFKLDEISHLTVKKNPMSEYCDMIKFLALKDGIIVGRVLGIINKAFNKDKNVKQARFSRIDFIDDYEVSKALIEKIEEWALLNKMDTVIGPIGFSDLDKQGLLVEGFNEYDTFITYYHYPYYKDHLDRLGYVKDVDWIEFQVPFKNIKEEDIKKAEVLANFVEKRYGYKLLKLKSRFKMIKYGKRMFEVYNEAFSKLYGFQPIPPKVANFYIKQVALIINLKYCWFVVDKNDNVVGFGLMVPSMAKVTKKYGGRLTIGSLFGYIKAIYGKKIDILDLYFIAVKPELHSLGIVPIIFADGIKKGIQSGAKIAETGPELELNHKIVSLWKKYDSRQHRRRRCYIKKLNID